MRKAFISGHEPILDKDGNEVGLKLAVSVWEGDERDPPGMRDLGSRELSFKPPFNYLNIQQAVKQAAQEIAGVKPGTWRETVQALNEDLKKVPL